MSRNVPPVSSVEPIELSSDLPLPLYLQLARHLRNEIISGKLDEQGALPGERELAETFQVSRVTVRKALRALTAEGLLSKRQGAGSFVNRSPHMEQRLSALTSFTEDMASRGMTSASQWLGRTIAVATPEEALALGLRPGEEVARMHRLRLADQTPVAIESSVVPLRYLPNPLEVGESLYAHLRALGFPPHRALQRLSAVRVTPELAEQLQVPDGAPALYIERRTFLENGAPLEFVRSHYRGNSYDFVVELTLT